MLAAWEQNTLIDEGGFWREKTKKKKMFVFFAEKDVDVVSCTLGCG